MDSLLPDRLGPRLAVLFVGINPGLRSAATGHHFAGFSNRFWKLLSNSGLVPERITYLDDDRLPAWGLGITNLVARPTRGINDLRPGELLAGWTTLDAKIAACRPRIVALVGVTLYRALQPLLTRSGGLRPAGPPIAVARGSPMPRSAPAGAPLVRDAARQQRVQNSRGEPHHGLRDARAGEDVRRPGDREAPVLGLRPEAIHGARVFVLPNPSGRNAHFTYADMLRAYRELRRVKDER